jgi:hypothetical protein
MHASFHVKVEMGSGRLKFKWKWVMKCFDLTKENCNQLFKVVALLTNFLHMHCQDFTFEVIGEHLNDLT